MITIYKADATELLKLKVTDESYSYNSIMGDNTLTLYFSLTYNIDIPIGAYCTFMGEKYSLKKYSNFKKNGTRNFEYTLLLETDMADLKIWKVRNTVDHRLKFSFTAKPEEQLQLLINNANLRGSGWKIGSCVSDSEITIEYNHTYILDALNQIADKEGTEWQISDKTISLGKVEFNKTDPLQLQYGVGFKPGISRETDQMPIEILLIEGSEKNIDFSKYGNKTLLLPKSQTLQYEGNTYVSSEDGTQITNQNTTPVTFHEDSLDCTDIYPQRVGTISSVVEVDAESHEYDFIDSSIPNDLNFTDYLISGETMTVIFQSGMRFNSIKYD